MLVQAWMLPSDPATDPAAQNVGDKTVHPAEPQQRCPLGTRLLQLANAAHVSILARLTDTPMTDPGPPSPASTVQSFLDGLAQRSPSPIHKWRRGPLVSADPRWHREEADLPPAGAAGRLRGSEAANGGMLPLRDFRSAAPQLRPGQLRALAEEVPAMTAAESLHALLAAVAGSQLQLNAVGREAGLLVSPRSLTAARAASPFLDGLPAGMPVTRLRFAIRSRDVTGENRGPVVVGAAGGPDGTWQAFYSFTYPAKRTP